MLCVLSVLLLLATLGLGAWGLYEGLHATRHLSTRVFNIVAAARVKVSDRMSVLSMGPRCQKLQREAPLRNGFVVCCDIARYGRASNSTMMVLQAGSKC